MDEPRDIFKKFKPIYNQVNSCKSHEVVTSQFVNSHYKEIIPGGSCQGTAAKLVVVACVLQDS